MKMTKRMLAAALALLMLLGLMPLSALPVLAGSGADWDDAMELTLDAIAYSSHESSQAWFVHTPDEDGTYVFKSLDEEGLDPKVSVYEDPEDLSDCIASDDDTGDDYNFYCELALTAGTTYYFLVEMIGGDDVRTVPVILTANTNRPNAADIGLHDSYDVDIYEEYAYEWYRFTSETGGYYVFYSYDREESVDPKATLYSYTMEELTENDDYTDSNFRIERFVAAGETVYLKAYAYDDTTGTYSLKMEQLASPTDMHLAEGDTFTTYICEDLYLTPLFSPEGAYCEQVTWQSDNTSVLELVQDNGCFYAKAPGTATVTATSESGLTATCEVTVKEVPVLALDAPQEFTLMEQGEYVCFDFTPSESGDYEFVLDAMSEEFPDLGYDLVNDADDYYVETSQIDRDGQQIVQAHLFGGETYRLLLEKTDATSGSRFTVCVQEMPEATGIAIYSNYENAGMIGQTYELWHEMVPSTAIREPVTYTSSDPDVVEIVDDNYFHLLAEGTATITGTSESGFTDTIEVRVEDYPTIRLDETTTVVLEEGESYFAKFVPTASGYYSFASSNNSGDPFAVLYDVDMNGVMDNDDGAGDRNFRMQVYLDAGATYLLEVRGYGNEAIACDVKVTKATKATKIAIKEGTTCSVYQGALQEFHLVYTPGNAVWEKITWKSSNSNVVKVLQTNTDSVIVQFKGAGKATLTATTATTKLTAKITITVTAAVATSLNTVKTGTITKTRRNYSFKYTPSATGDYLVRTSSKKYVWTYVYDANGVLLEHNYENTAFRYSLKAKTTYYFTVTMDDNETGEFTFLIQNVKALTGITLSETALTGFVGDVLELPSVMAQPVLAGMGSVSWTVADRQIAYIEDDELFLLKPGTTTLTATCGGKKATATVTVSDVTAIPYTMGEEVTVEYDVADPVKYYAFQVPEDAAYIFNSYGDTNADPVATVYDSNWNELGLNDDGGESYHFRLKVDLQAGQRYYLKIHLYNNGSFSPFDWVAVKADRATAVEIVQGNIVGYVNDETKLDVNFLPGNTVEEEYEFSATGDAVEVSEDGWVYFCEVGTATVTVTTESGLTASITITVKEYEAMTLGQVYPLLFAQNNSFCMTFTPLSDGVYSFYTSAGVKGIHGEIEGLENWQDQKEHSDGYYMAQAKLTAGVTYRLWLYQYSEYEPEVPVGSTVSVVKVDQRATPVIATDSTTKIQGTEESLHLAVTSPTTEIVEVLGWTTSDPKIATVDRWGNVRYIRAGKVTLTAQCTYGDAKVTLTIQAATAMTQSKEYVAKVVNGECPMYKFAPKKDGYYTFYIYGNNGENGIGGEIMDPQGGYLNYEVAGSATTQQLIAYLVTGQTYYLVTDFRSGGPDITPTTSYKVKVGSGKAPAAVKGVFRMVSNASSAYVPTGEKAVVRIKAEGEGLTYRWYYANKDKYTYATSSITKDTYSVTMDSTRNGRKLFCVVTDKYGNKMTSHIVTIGIKKPLKITTQLTNAVAKNGGSIKTSFVASGDGLTYTWYYKDAGATDFAVTTSFTSTSYSTTMNSVRANRQIFCVVRDKYGNAVKTNTVTLYMGTPLKITTQPKNVKVKNGTTAKATVKAVGDGLTYTWYVKNPGGKSYSKSSITKSTYSVKMTSKISGRLVYCVVKDKYGKSVKSTTVSLKKK